MMFSKYTVLFSLLAAIVLLNGCDTSSPENLGGPTEPPAVSLVVGDETEYAELLEKHRGKVVLVDFWASWCVPCIQQFPHTVEFSQKYKDQGLAVIAVSCDDPDDREKVLAFLKSQGAEFDNLLSRHGGSPQTYDAFAINSGAVPHYRIYNRAGELHREFSGGDDELIVTPELIEEEVKRLLEQ